MDACPDLVGDSAYGSGSKSSPTTFGRLLQQVWEQHTQEVGALQAEVRRLCFEEGGHAAGAARLGQEASEFGVAAQGFQRRSRASTRGSPILQDLRCSTPAGPEYHSQAALSADGAAAASSCEDLQHASAGAAGASAGGYVRQSSWNKNAMELHEIHEEWAMRDTSGGQDRVIASVVSQAIKHERLQSSMQARRTIRGPQTKSQWRTWSRAGSGVEALNLASWRANLFSRQMLCSLFMLSPSGRQRMVWDVLGVTCLMFDLAWIPMQVFEPPRDATVKAVEYVVLFYWTLDLAANFLTGYYSNEGKLIMSPKKIAMRYVKSWLVLDCLIIASDYLATLLDHVVTSTRDAQGAGLARVARMTRMTRALRAMRLLRLLKVREIVHMIQEHIESEALLILYGMLQNIMVLVILAHLLACIWFWIGTGHRFSDTWITHNGLEDVYWGYQYVTSLSWSLTQFTPASGDIFARNLTERGFFVGVLLISMIFFSSFVGSITSGMTRLRGLKSNKLTQQYMLRKFLSENRISRDLSARIARYVELAFELHQRKTDRSKVELLLYLSGPLQVEMQRELYEPHLLLNVFFLTYKERSTAAMNQLCSTAVQKLSFSKGDRLFESASEASHMFILVSGALVYKRMEGLRGCRKLALVRPGQSFGEAVLWLPWYHSGTMIAAIESEVVALSSTKFRTVTLAHPSVFMLACNHARQFVAELKHELYEKKRHVFDLPQDIMYSQPSEGSDGSRRSSVGTTDQDFLEEEIMAEYSESSEESDYEDDTEESPGHLRSTFGSSAESGSLPASPTSRLPVSVSESGGEGGAAASGEEEQPLSPPAPTAASATDGAPGSAVDTEGGEGALSGRTHTTKLTL